MIDKVYLIYKNIDVIVEYDIVSCYKIYYIYLLTDIYLYNVYYVNLHYLDFEIYENISCYIYLL